MRAATHFWTTMGTHTLLAGWVFFGQAVTPMFGLGAAMVIAGVITSQL